MRVPTLTEFMALLRDNRLLQPDQLDELNDEFLKRYPEVRLLAKYLLQRGWLTVYQVNQIFQGNAQELVLGPYRIMDSIGEGGVSQVFKAWDTRRKCIAALKAIRSEHLDNVEAVGRLKREMRVIGQLSHPNIVKAFDIDSVRARHYFAMEYVEGTDLSKLIKLSGPLPMPQACDYIRQAALGLQHAHEKGLVHRDIKPGNLLVTMGGTMVKILDMGMARLRQSASQPAQESINQLTVEGVMIGTPDYLAPEQSRDPHNVDIRADIYSLGCTLYFLLSGRVPFPGNSVMDKIYKHQKMDPDWSVVPGLDKESGVAAVLKKMMAKKPPDRYQTPAEVAEALAPYCRAATATD